MHHLGVPNSEQSVAPPGLGEFLSALTPGLRPGLLSAARYRGLVDADLFGCMGEPRSKQRFAP
jgi:hypothetical protein